MVQKIFLTSLTIATISLSSFGANAGESYNCELDASASKGWVPSTIQISFNDDKELTKLYSADYPPYDLELAKVLRYTKDFREIKYIEQSKTSTGALLKNYAYYYHHA